MFMVPCMDYNKWAWHYMIHYKISYYFTVYVSNLEKHVTIFKMYTLHKNHSICRVFRSNRRTSIKCRTTQQTKKYHASVKRFFAVHRYTRKMLYYYVTCNRESALSNGFKEID